MGIYHIYRCKLALILVAHVWRYLVIIQQPARYLAGGTVVVSAKLTGLRLVYPYH